MTGIVPETVRRYLARRAVREPWRLAGDPAGAYHGAVVIPSLAEGPSLFRTLDCLADNPAEQRARYLVIVVVNQRQDAAPALRRGNLRDLQELSRQASHSGLHLAWVDAASAGLELPSRQGGVGLARRIGCDLALEHLDWSGRPLLVSLDADTLVEPNYLAVVTAHFAAANAGAAVLPFRHQPAGGPAQQTAIDRYELFIRCHALGLARAGSPYAFTAVGSAMAARAMTYVRCGGMPRRQAGEDFYFLQQAVKTDGVARLCGTRVRPSARLSGRTPFGTGQSITTQLDENSRPLLFYPAAAYRIIERWLRTASQLADAPKTDLSGRAAEVSPALDAFLAENRFPEAWQRIRQTHAGSQARLRAFHIWFDGLKTLRLLHRLCARDLLRRPLEEIVPELFQWCGLPAADLGAGLALLRSRQEQPKLFSIGSVDEMC